MKANCTSLIDRAVDAMRSGFAKYPNVADANRLIMRYWAMNYRQHVPGGQWESARDAEECLICALRYRDLSMGVSK